MGENQSKLIQINQNIAKIRKKGDSEMSEVINCDFNTKLVQYGFINSIVSWVCKNRTIWGVPV